MLDLAPRFRLSLEATAPTGGGVTGGVGGVTGGVGGVTGGVTGGGVTTGVPTSSATRRLAMGDPRPVTWS
ncbi:MAG: hypothetical protein EBS30_19975 [Planctomycetes bacterium]|nr:hypothetical protein [Planctomycetota bacterium]